MCSLRRLLWTSNCCSFLTARYEWYAKKDIAISFSLDLSLVYQLSNLIILSNISIKSGTLQFVGNCC